MGMRHMMYQPCYATNYSAGPGWFLPLTTFGFGAASIATAFVKTRAQACAVRFVLGIFEAGVMPACAYYLSRWYRRSELTFRLGLWMTMAPLSGAIGGLLASGILKMNHLGALHGWQMYATARLMLEKLQLTCDRIFVVEGIITMGLALVAFVTLTDRPDTARWLSEDQKELAVNRVKSERLGQTVLLDKIDAKKLKRGFLNPITLATASIFLLDNITVLGISFFLPTIVRTIYPNRTTVQLQLLTVPPYVVGAACTVIITTLSWRFNHRQTLIACTGPTVIAGFAIFLATMDANVRYAAVFLSASTAFSLGAMTNAQVSANVLSDSARSIAIGTNGEFTRSQSWLSNAAYLLLMFVQGCSDTLVA
jgi:MFS family permease